MRGIHGPYCLSLPAPYRFNGFVGARQSPQNRSGGGWYPRGDTRIKTAALGSQARPSGLGPDQGLGTPEGPPAAQAAPAGRPAGLTLPALRIAKVAAPAAAGLFTAAPELQRDSPRTDSPQRGTRCRIVRAQRVPVGTRGMVPDLGFGGSGTSTPTSSSLQSLISLQNQARINVIGQGQEVMGVAHPLVKAALKSVKVNKFSGRSEDFEEWEMSWNQYLRLMYGGQWVLPDQTVLMTLKGYLDEASAADLQARLNADDNLSYYAFMDGLRARHMRDVRATHRQNWSMVKLQRLGKVPTLQEWSRFQANYLAKRALVEDWSDAEDQKLVFTQVPGCFHQKVLTETNRRRRDRAWVRVAVPESLTCQEVLQELERALGVALPRCHMDRRHFVIQCEGPAQQA